MKPPIKTRNPFVLLGKQRKAVAIVPRKGKGSFKRNPKHKEIVNDG